MVDWLTAESAPVSDQAPFATAQEKNNTGYAIVKDGEVWCSPTTPVKVTARRTLLERRLASNLEP